MKSMTVIGLTTLLLAATAARAATAADNWTQSCASCHGDDGVGKTKMGRKAGVKDLTDAAYQKGFTDDQAFANLKNGEKGDDGKVKMKAYGDKLSDAELRDLIAYSRALAKGAPGPKT